MRLRTNQIGWLFVAAQVVLLVLLVLLPTKDHWPSNSGLTLVGNVLFYGGILLIVVASTRLGSALTPTPVPTSGGELRTSGLYGLVRHPIYTGVLSVVIGIAIGSRSLVTLAVGIVTIGFFYVKSHWEEQQLRRRYGNYDHYASQTPRFVPRLGRR